jgi:hypothetical protein
MDFFTFLKTYREQLPILLKSKLNLDDNITVDAIKEDSVINSSNYFIMDWFHFFPNLLSSCIGNDLNTNLEIRNRVTKSKLLDLIYYTPGVLSEFKNYDVTSI